VKPNEFGSEAFELYKTACDERAKFAQENNKLKAELSAAREKNRELNRRAQCVPQWRKLSEATKEQATGRFYPAVMRLALTEALQEVEDSQRVLRVIRIWASYDMQHGPTALVPSDVVKLCDKVLKGDAK
jgi:hypothetical protein